MLERLEPLRLAARSEAENLGHAVVQLVSLQASHIFRLFSILPLNFIKTSCSLRLVPCEIKKKVAHVTH